MIDNKTLPMTIVAIDVETVNPQGAICEFAAVAIDCMSDKVLFTVSSLVDPGQVDWIEMTTRIHGIQRHQVDGKPLIADVWKEFTSKLTSVKEPRLFAHGGTERSCLEKALGEKFRQFTIKIECTLALAKSSLQLPSYKLSTVCKALGIPFDETHRATPDATATAHVARHLLLKLPLSPTNGSGQAPIDPPPKVTRLPPKRITPNPERGNNKEIIANTPKLSSRLAEFTVCITGQFACGWSRKEGKAKVAAHGGTPIDNVTGSCNLLVIAGKTEGLQPSDYATEKVRKAKALNIQVIDETKLLKMIEGSDRA